MKDGLNIATLPSPLDRYTLATKLGSGIFGEVFRASDTQAAGKAVAVKVQTYTDDTEVHIQKEYKILRDFSKHPNLIDFYGVFCEKSEGVKRIWFVLEVWINMTNRIIFIRKTLLFKYSFDILFSLSLK